MSELDVTCDRAGVTGPAPEVRAGTRETAQADGNRDLRLGIDVGSTTVKAVVVDARSGRLLFTRYRRHHAEVARTCRELLEEAFQWNGGASLPAAVCGSAGKPVAEALGVFYVQEVVASTVAVRRLFPQARAAIELGGQDAKVVFFGRDQASGEVVATDMRMNGSCAGGTGAFIDEIAKLLDARDGLEELAARGRKVYEISGRCGVFAKTDIQPLLIQGVSREDLALSTFHAIAKQTIGGLSQGLELKPPIVFEGGPLTYNPTLVRVFAERLDLGRDEVLIPEHPETFVARGAALAIDELGDVRMLTPETAEGIDDVSAGTLTAGTDAARPLFADDAEREAFLERHARSEGHLVPVPAGTGELDVYVGVDAGSTTSKVALVNADGDAVDTYYAHNDGDSVAAVRAGLLQMEERWRQRGVRLNVRGLCTTGYGQAMLGCALGADCGIVETVAHAEACCSFVPDATFILDIGGQDMKAIWLNHGTITNVMLNEACSSGCGSFLENFADGLGIRVEDIADEAFSSRHPASLGSRCTVFMTSTIINEQRNGKRGNDIMAGLCRSIIQNVFTKVVRLSDTSELGERVVVQGGTFRNLAVLRALEEYLGIEVVRAPFPGEMGAIGAALHAMRNVGAGPSSFIGFDALRSLGYDRQSNVRCDGCANACLRTVTRFNTGAAFVVGNRCERGARVEGVTQARREERRRRAANLFEERARMLFEDYPYEPVRDPREETIGLPRVLEFWDSMPFWTTFLRALGYRTVFSHPSSHEQFEAGLRYVASDTICLPAKICHGHVLDLCRQGVDRILFPHVMHLPPEGTDKTSPYTCAIVMGYPMVVRNFQDPAAHFDVRFDTPVFHWFSEKNRHDQICAWARESLSATAAEAEGAYRQAERAILGFRRRLSERGRQVLDEVHEKDGTAVVVAGRPYHTDPFISHGISRRFSEQGIPVLTADSLPGQRDLPLDNLLPEVTNNFHTRMLQSALYAACDPSLEYVQIVSFGCGHDAILTDELTRILEEVGGKHPLVLKVDESDAAGSVDIRIRSFVATMHQQQSFSSSGSEPKAAGMSREAAPQEGMSEPEAAKPEGEAGLGSTYERAMELLPDALPNPYRVAYTKEDARRRTVLIPNISSEISEVLCGAMRSAGYRATTIPVGGIEQIQLGKRYTHNDICFPCQMVIGEAIDALQRGNYRHDEVAVGMVKFKCDCRMSNYAALLRRALDKAGFADVPILTTDPVDTKGMHPGVAMLGPRSVIKALWGAMMLDILEDLKRKTLPYELNPGETRRVFGSCVDDISQALEHGLRPAVAAYRSAIDRMAAIPYDRSVEKPRVLVTGELLVTYHPGSNFRIEDYLNDNGMEAIFPRMTDQLRKDFIAAMSEISDYKANMTKESFPITALFDLAQSTMERIARRHPLYEDHVKPAEMYEEVRDIIPITLSCGEGWLMAAEIVHYAKQGVRSFVILQPFGCLPNHICGRGVTKRIKDRFPGIQILPLDLDPDTSYANVENRLQMLIMNDRSMRTTHRSSEAGESAPSPDAAPRRREAVGST